MTMSRYGDVEFDRCNILSLLQTPVYADETDYLYTTFRVTISALVHGQSVGGHTQNISLGGNLASTVVSNDGKDPTNVPLGAGGQYNSLRLFLMSPRQEFSLRTGNRVFLHAGAVSTVAAGAKVTLQPGEDPVPLNADVMNGPRPIDCKLTSFVGDASIHVEWTVEVNIRECPGGQPSPTVLGNRWSLSDEIDGDFFTTRTLEGVLHLVAGSINPHTMRGLVLPPLAKGFRRDRMTFAATPDLSKLKYTVVDREMFAAPPPPGTRWSMKHGEEFTAAKTIGTCQVLIVGSRLSNKTQMRFVASRIAYWRVIGDAAKGTNLIKHILVTDTSSESENRIEFTIQAMRTGKDNTAQQFGAGRATLVLDSKSTYQGQPVVKDYDPEVMSNPGISGTSSIFGAFVTALQDSCMPDHSFVNVAVPGAPSNTDGTPLPTLQAYKVDQIAEAENPEYSASHNGAMYVSYRSESRYQTVKNRASADLATTQKSSSGGSSGADTPSPSVSQEGTVVFDLAKPSTRRTLMIEAERVGDWPELPQPEDYTDEAGIKHSVMDYTMQPGAAEVLVDGSQLYRMVMNVTFQMSRAPLDGAKAAGEGTANAAALIGAGILPWLKKDSPQQPKAFHATAFLENVDPPPRPDAPED